MGRSMPQYQKGEWKGEMGKEGGRIGWYRGEAAIENGIGERRGQERVMGLEMKGVV